MNRSSRSPIAGACALAMCIACPSLAWSETWSDKSGNFRIEADYVAVQGKSVVLRKPDGSTINVPIDRLSNESRAQAKRLYDLSKTSAPAATGSSTAEPASTYTPQAKKLNFDAPAARTIPPMPAFPENASLQETVDFIRTQLLAGHPEVFWHALPEDFRMKVDSDELRESLMPAIEKQAEANKLVEVVILKAVEVLVKKKEFVLNSSMMTQVPPPLMQNVQQAYDPAVGAAYELATFSFGAGALEDMTVTQMLDYHGPRIGGHLRELVHLAPPGMIDGFLSQITTDQSSETTGTVTAPDKDGQTDTVDVVRYGGRWVPKEFATKWDEQRETMVADLIEKINLANQNDEAVQQAQMMMGVFVTMANGVLDPMLQADTQEQFDQSVMQVAGMLSMISGGGGANGPN